MKKLLAVLCFVPVVVVVFRMKTANKEHSQYQMYMDILVGDLDKLAKGE